MAEFKTVLAIDTAMNACSVALCKAGSDEMFVHSEPMPRGQAEHLMPAIEGVVEQGGGYEDIDAIVTTRGPGTFTGLRVGLSTARALGLARGISVFAISTLQALAYQYVSQNSVDEFLGVLIETKRDDFYFQSFEKNAKPHMNPVAMPAGEIENMLEGTCVFMGDAVQRFQDEIGDTPHYIFDSAVQVPDPAIMARALVEPELKWLFSEDVSPLYLRPPDVTPPAKAAQ